MAKRLFAILGVLFLVAAGAAAQGTTSRLVGTVTDATGGVLPGVTVTLTNEATGLSYTTTTTDVGTYLFEALSSGSYTVKAELAGFKTVTATKNPVEIGQPTTVNIKMEPGEITETVQVVAASEIVQTSTSGNYGAVVDQTSIERLPIVGVSRGRNPLDLVNTMPGVVSGANTGGGTHVNGARDRSWNFTLDGIDINETSAGGSNFSPLRANPDMLSEFKVLTGNQTAEYGRNSGAQVAMVTRSGSNQFRGTGFYFYRDPSFQANEWERNVRGTQKDEYTQKIGGFSLGGPILRNKAFFFGNLQILRGTITRQVERTVYTEQARNGIWRYVIGGRNQPAGVTGASVDINGNVLPGVNVGTYSIVANDPQRIGFDPTVRALIGQTPLPNNFRSGDGLNTAGFQFFPTETEEQYDAIVRVDYSFNSNHSAMGRVAWGEQNTLCDSVNGGLPLYEGMDCNVNTYRKPKNFAANWRWSVRSNMVNEFVVGMNNFLFDFQLTGSDPSRPYIFSAPITIPYDSEFGNKRELTTWQFVDNLSWVTGAHQFKFGTNMRFQRHEDVRGSVSGVNVTPWFDFSTTVNTVDPATFGIPGDINTTFDRPNLQSSINFILGRVGTIQQGFVSTGSQYAPGGTLFLFDARFPEVDFFAQDSWKLSQNMTMDLGLRWELKLAPSNPDGLIRRPNARVAAGEEPSSTLSWIDESLYENDLNNVAPSVGWVWDPKGDGKSAIRGNYRMAFDRINTFVLSSAIFQSIPGITAGVTNTAYGQAGGRLPGLPSLQPTFTPESALTPPPVSSNSMRVVDTSFDSPLTHAWAASYQREVWRQTVLEVAYIGRHAESLFGAYNANQVEIQDNGFVEAFNIVRAGGQSALMNQLVAPDTRRLATETGSDMVRRLYASNLSQNSVAALAGSLATRVQGGQTLPQLSGLGPYFFLAYPQYLGGMIVIDSGDWSNYHAMQLKLEKRFGGGYGYMLSYTLSRSKDTRSFDPAFTTVATANSQSAGSTPFDINNRELNYARSDFDRLHALSGTFVAELPFGQGKWIGKDVNSLVNSIIGGWEVAGRLQLWSGRPFTVYSGTNTFSNIVQTPANCDGCESGMGSAYNDEATGLKWFFQPDERAKFSQPGAGEFSNVGRNGFDGPRWFNIDMTIAKRFRVYRQQTLEFRCDMTNLTNTPSFGFPTATTTSTTFGRIYDTVASYSRKMQLGLKYTF